MWETAQRFPWLHTLFPSMAELPSTPVAAQQGVRQYHGVDNFLQIRNDIVDLLRQRNCTMSTLEELGAFIVNAGRDGFSPSVRNVARLHLVDTVGVWAAGAATPEGRLVSKITESLQAIPGFQNYGEALLQKVVLRCALARQSEMDAINLSAMIT